MIRLGNIYSKTEHTILPRGLIHMIPAFPLLDLHIVIKAIFYENYHQSAAKDQTSIVWLVIEAADISLGKCCHLKDY